MQKFDDLKPRDPCFHLLLADKTAGRENHKQATTEDSCSKDIPVDFDQSV